VAVVAGSGFGESFLQGFCGISHGDLFFFVRCEEELRARLATLLMFKFQRLAKPAKRVCVVA
jgi:hypothetical protein